MDLTKEKLCENCRFYSQHYSKRDNAFKIVYCGHCLRKEVKKLPVKKSCEFWEDIAIKIEERKLDIYQSIIKMSQRLDELTMILKDDMGEQQ